MLKSLFSPESRYKLELFFRTRYPDIARKGKKLLSLMRKTGFQTPARQSELAGKILDRYDLWKICYLLNSEEIAGLLAVPESSQDRSAR
jgi:hypothetical protein